MGIFKDYAWGRLYTYFDDSESGTNVVRFPDKNIIYNAVIKDEYKNSTPAYTTLWEAKSGNTSAEFDTTPEVGDEEVTIKATGTAEGYSYFYLRIVPENDTSNYLYTVELAVVGILEETILVKAINIVPSTLNMHKGDSRQLTVEFIPSDATYKDIVWSVPEESNCIISPTNSSEVTVTAIDTGTAKITCETTTLFNNVKAQITANVTQSVKSNSIISIENDYVYIDNIYRPAVKITGLSYGTATVICTTVDGSIQEECLITVNETGTSEGGSVTPSGNILLHVENNTMLVSNTHNGNAQNGSFAVTCEDPWECNTQDTWIFPTNVDLFPWSGAPASGKVLYYQLLANNTTSSRTGQITGTNTVSGNTSIFTIYQDASENNLKLRLEDSNNVELVNETFNLPYIEAHTTVTVIPQKKIGNTFEYDSSLAWTVSCNNGQVTISPSQNQYTGRCTLNITVPENSTSSTLTTILSFSCSLDGFTSTNSLSFKQAGHPVQQTDIKLVLLNVNEQDITNSTISNIPYSSNTYSFYVYPYKLNNGNWEVSQSVSWTISTSGSMGFTLQNNSYTGTKLITVSIAQNSLYEVITGKLTFNGSLSNLTCSAYLNFSQEAMENPVPTSLRMLLLDTNDFVLESPVVCSWNDESISFNVYPQGKYSNNDNWEILQDADWTITVTSGTMNLSVSNLQNQYTGGPVLITCQFSQNTSEVNSTSGSLLFSIPEYNYSSQIDFEVSKKPALEYRIQLLNASNEDITNTNNISISSSGENYTIKVYPQKKLIGDTVWNLDSSMTWSISQSGDMNLTIENQQLLYTGMNTINIVVSQNTSLTQELLATLTFSNSNSISSQVGFVQGIDMQSVRLRVENSQGQVIACSVNTGITGIPRFILLDSTADNYVMTVYPERYEIVNHIAVWSVDNTISWSISQSGDMTISFSPNYQQYTGTNTITMSYSANSTHDTVYEEDLTFITSDNLYSGFLKFKQAFTPEVIDAIKLSVHPYLENTELNGTIISLPSSDATSYRVDVFTQKEVDSSWLIENNISWTVTIENLNNGVSLSTQANQFIGSNDLTINFTENTSTSTARTTRISFAGTYTQDETTLTCSTYIEFFQPPKTIVIDDIRVLLYYNGSLIDTSLDFEIDGKKETYQIEGVPQKYDTTNGWVEDTDNDVQWYFDVNYPDNIGLTISPTSQAGYYTGRTTLSISVPAFFNSNNSYRTSSINFDATYDSLTFGDELIIVQQKSLTPGSLVSLDSERRFYYDTEKTLSFKVSSISSWRVTYERTDFSNTSLGGEIIIAQDSTYCTNYIFTYTLPENNNYYSYKYTFKLYVENTLIYSLPNFIIYPNNLNNSTDGSTVFNIGPNDINGNAINNHIAEEHVHDIYIESNVQATVTKQDSWFSLGVRQSNGNYTTSQNSVNINIGRTSIRLECQHNYTGLPRTGHLTIVSTDAKAIQTLYYEFIQSGTEINTLSNYAYFNERVVVVNNDQEIAVLNIHSNVISGYTAGSVTFVNTTPTQFGISESGIEVRVVTGTPGSIVLVNINNPSQTYDEGTHIMSLGRGTALQEQERYSLY